MINEIPQDNNAVSIQWLIKKIGNGGTVIAGGAINSMEVVAESRKSGYNGLEELR